MQRCSTQSAIKNLDLSFYDKGYFLRDDRLLWAKPLQQQSNKAQGRGIWIPSLRENLQNFCGNL